MSSPKHGSFSTLVTSNSQDLCITPSESFKQAKKDKKQANKAAKKAGQQPQTQMGQGAAGGGSFESGSSSLAGALG